MDQNLACRHCNTLIIGDELWTTQNCVLTLGCVFVKYKIYKMLTYFQKCLFDILSVFLFWFSDFDLMLNPLWIRYTSYFADTSYLSAFENMVQNELVKKIITFMIKA